MKGKKTLVIAAALLLTLSLFFVPQSTKAAIAGSITIGIIGPQALASHWYPSGMWAGAELAAMEINSSGGIYLSSGPNGAGNYTITLVKGHEHAITGDLGAPEPGKAYDEMIRLCNISDAIVGGFRTECVLKIIQAAVEEEKPYFINGASTSGLTNATTQPYVWRNNPVNSTMLFKTIAGALAGFLIPEKLEPIFGCDHDGNASTPGKVKFAVLAENLEWTYEMFYYLTTPGVYPLVLGESAELAYADMAPATTTDFTTYLDAINASKARLLIHIFSGAAGIPLMAQFGARGIKAMPVGINVMGQLQQHWANTGGGCDYESILNFAGTATPIVPGVTDVFWDNFVGNYSAWPMYTAWGAYDSVHAIAEAFEAIGNTDKVQLKTHLETDYTRQGLNGQFNYTSSHDVYSDDTIPPYHMHVSPLWTSGYIRAMVVQWQVQWDEATPIGGRMEVVCPVDQIYSKKWAIPPEMYPLLEDVNYDGKVDMRDIGITARAFGSYPGHPRWEKEADINFDNKVDMRDIGGTASKFGTTHPLPALPC
jgi:branched-chain amino acid transport system substrate-binding protein